MAAPGTTASRHYTPEIRHSAEEFEDEATFLTHVYNTIASSTHHQELIYTEVTPSWGANLVGFLNEVAVGARARKHYNSKTKVFWARLMPTEIHNCYQEWYRNQADDWMDADLLTATENRHLTVRVGTTIDFFQPPYSGSRKEPDLLTRPDNQRLPTVVIESGWSEAFSRLKDDMNLWLVGGNGAVLMSNMKTL